MKFEFDNNTPIYIQLVEQFKIYIISEQIEPGQKLPSVRDLALQIKVNPNTVQKALAELEDLKLVYTERTNGKFVTDDKKLIDRYRKEYASELTKKYISGMSNLGFKKEDIIKHLGGDK